MRRLTKESARELALSAVSRQWSSPLAIQDELTRELDFGWVFFYNSAEFVRKHNPEAALFGNAPLIVSHDGHVSSTGTAHEIDEYIAAYRALGSERFDAGEAETYILSMYRNE